MTRRQTIPLLLLGLTALFALSARPAAADGGFKVVAYYPAWRSLEHLDKLRGDAVTHLIYAFAIPTAEGDLLPLEDPEGARALIRAARERGIRVLLGVGGWSHRGEPLEDTFAAATATPARRSALAAAIADLCRQYGFDGVDLDWEYPRTGSTARQYEALVLELAALLRPEGRLLTAAVLGGVSPDGAPYAGAMAYTDAALAALDWVNVMAYDGDEGSGHATRSFARACGAYWREARGLPAEKVVLGLPFFAKPGPVSYAALAAAHPEAGEGDTLVHQGRQVWYNGRATVADKTAYALEELGGVMIWELTQDSEDPGSSLLAAVEETVRSRRWFADVPRDAWYAEELEAARRAGLVRGSGDRRFRPADSVSLGEAVSLAARLHRLHEAGTDDLVQGEPWYAVYGDYALAHGILAEPLTAEGAARPVTRGEFALLLAAALPPEALPALNRVERLPDVAPGDPWGEAVYRLYRAGVLTGVDRAGTFLPRSPLTRAEAAVLALRMREPERRQRLDL